MENLRETLKLLFLHRNVDRLVEDFLSDNPMMVHTVNGDWFTHHFPSEMLSYSLNQTEQVYNLLCQQWMQPSGEHQSLIYYEGASIYNVLLHFAKETLSETDGVPLCQYARLLRWHELSSQLTEDLFVTAFLAANDLKAGTTRRDFAWKPVLDHENGKFNKLFDLPLADLHFHLIGSSPVFELNWLAIMNLPEKTLEVLKNDVQPSWWLRSKLSNEESKSWLDKSRRYLILAVSIRNYIFRFLNNALEKDDEEFVRKVLSCDDQNVLETYHAKLIEKVKGNADSAYKYHRDDSVEDIDVDYAILPDSICYNKNEIGYLYTTLGGERRLMYQVFLSIYSGKAGWIETLFYLYIVIKSKFRYELVQMNSLVGFANFSEYDERKMIFSKPNPYGKLVKQMAVRGFLNRKERYLEVRTIPFDSADGLKNSIRNTTKAINNTAFLTGEWGDDFWYILHFIKCKEDEQQRFDEAHARHETLRETVANQASAIVEWKSKDTTRQSDKVVGVDAANSECYCRPEVFGQAFRYLRNYQPSDVSGDASIIHFTYHVGEDYYDVVDGLRAIEEALLFLELRENDRVGHALVLGEDVAKFYDGCHHTVVMPRQLFLDNIVWMLYRGRELAAFDQCKDELEQMFLDEFKTIYTEYEGASKVEDYYQSWLLRGDNPVCYQKLDSNKPTKRLPNFWTEFDMIHADKIAAARENETACILYSAYHYDKRVKERGSMSGEFRVSDNMIRLISELQESMLDKFEELGIGIECNPTSNLKIGRFKRYNKHPIFTFNNKGLIDMGKKRGIKVSINTDDKGIFATSLEREYSLLAAALEKDYQKGTSKNSPDIIMTWLNQVREMTYSQKFA